MSPIEYVVEEGVALVERQNESQNGRPTNSSGLVLEAWAQGLMVGALIIMSFITLANMRRGVLLHKLILIEVASHLYTFDADLLLTVHAAHIRCVARLLHILQYSHLQLVAIRQCHLPQRFMVPA